MAAGAFGLIAVVLLGTAGVTRESKPPVARRDPGAARDLEALMRAGEQGSWSVSYEFSRTLAGGRVLRQPMQEARSPSLHMLHSGSAMTVDKGDRSYDCNLAGAGYDCTTSIAGTTLPASEVVRVAVSAGAYDVTTASTASIAGRRARCFRVLTTGHGQLPDLGVETDLCLTAAGVPLRQRVVRASGDVDERVARSVATNVTTRMIEAMIRGLDRNPATPQQ